MHSLCTLPARLQLFWKPAKLYKLSFAAITFAGCNQSCSAQTLNAANINWKCIMLPLLPPLHIRLQIKRHGLRVSVCVRVRPMLQQFGNCKCNKFCMFYNHNSNIAALKSKITKGHQKLSIYTFRVDPLRGWAFDCIALYEHILTILIGRLSCELLKFSNAFKCAKIAH